MAINAGILSRSAKFGNKPILLSQITTWALNGRLQLPQFQRPWLWGYSEVAALLESVVLGRDIGSLVLLESEGFSVGFKSQLLEGAEDKGNHTSITYLLDGRQRLTALTHTLCQIKF